MNLPYVSTRKQAPAVSFFDAVLRGLAPDGGLYVPEYFPQLPANWHENATYTDLAVQFIAPYTGLSAAELRDVIGDAFHVPLPIVQLAEQRYVLELFHGPTLAFKDFGARFLARVLDHVLRERDEHALIIVATSGDTGSAVADAFAGAERIRVALVYPDGMVSDVQEQQLTTPRAGVLPLKVNGTFDDCQRLVKTMLAHDRFDGRALSGANSINIARLLPQATYYLYAAQQLLHAGLHPREVTFVVPSGNLGNVTGGILAAQSGMPTAGFVAAHNANRYFPDVLAGKLPATETLATIPTISNAMDVGVPSNYERLRSWFTTHRVPEPTAVSISEAETLHALRREYERSEYVACPHTAVGFAAADQLALEGPHIVLATAHPAKFPAPVTEALGSAPQVPTALANIPMPASVGTIDPNDAAFAAALRNWL